MNKNTDDLMGKKSSLRKMKIIASGALVFCVIGMVLCRLLEHVHPWLVWPRAFFEAGTVGALADWFAVVALFRHPMGIPIPHTAILPNNKERVADSLANFLEVSFLTEDRLGPKFRGIDYAGFASRWLDEHGTMLAEKAAGYAPNIIGGLSDEEMVTLLGDRARKLIRTAEVGPMAGEGLDVLVQYGRGREIFAGVLKSTRQLIEENRTTIQAKIREEIPLSADLLKSVPFLKNMAGPLLEQVAESIAATVAGKTIEKVQMALEEASAEPDHSLWVSFDRRLHEFIGDLKTSPEMAQKIGTMQESLAGSQVVPDFAAKAWGEIKEFVLQDCASQDSTIRRKIEESIRTAARRVAENEEARQGINTFFGEQVLASILAARPHARELVVSTIAAWDAKEMSDKLEGTVGSDLQFIRLNGTLVGGLVGLFIYGVFNYIGK